MSPLNSLALATVVTPLARARRRSYSNFDEDRILREYVAMLLPKDHGYSAVDLGAGNGVRHSNTHALFTNGWRGLAVDGDANRSYRLARTYRNYPNVYTCRNQITPQNVVSLLEAYQIATDFEVLSLDIDSYDYWVLDALLAKFRPRIVVTEINEKIPPPIRFTVKYDPDFTLRHHFYGYSIASLEDLCARHDYGILELEYNNAFLAPAKSDVSRFIDAETAYAHGYLNRRDRKQRFKLNFDMEELLSMTPEEGLRFLRQFYSKEAGNYYLGLHPDPDLLEPLALETV